MTREEMIKLIDAEGTKILKNVPVKVYGVVVARMAESTFKQAKFREKQIPINSTLDEPSLSWEVFKEVPTKLGQGTLIRQLFQGTSPQGLTLCFNFNNVWPIVIDPNIDHGKVLISVWDINTNKYIPEPTEKP